jgi:hypothetical protein
VFLDFDLGEFGVRVGSVLLLLGAGVPALAADMPPLRASTLLGEPRRAGPVFESDELDPLQLEPSRGLSAASAAVAAEIRGSDPLDLPLAKSIGTRIRVSETAGYDSNVFRLSGAAAATAAGLAQMGDWLSTTRVGVGLEKSYAGQQLALDYDLSMARYGAFDFLNHNASTAVGRWRWTAGPNWKGELSTEYREALDDFAYYRSSQRSLGVTRQNTGSAFYRVVPGWEVGVQAAQGNRRYPDGTRPSNEIDFAGVDTVLRYVPDSGAVVAITRRKARGQYPNLPTDAGSLAEKRFEQEEFFVDASLPLRSGTRGLLRVGTISRSYGRYPQNDFAGRNGLLGLEWQITPRMQLNGALRYDVEPAQDFVSSYVATKRLAGGVLWDYSPKLRIEGRAEWRDAEYRGDPGFGARVAARRQDQGLLTSVAATWQVTAHTRWVTSLTRENRDSTEAGLSFNYWTLAGSLQWLF